MAGPFSGLFGGQTQQTTHSLDARGTLFGVFQKVSTDTSLADQGDARFRDDESAFGGASGGLNYSYGRQGNRGAFTANASGYANDYTIDPGRVSGSASASAGVSTRLTRQITFGASGSTSYSPYVGIGAFGVSGTSIVDQTLIGSDIQTAAVPTKNLVSSATTSVSGALTRRTTATANGTYMRTQFFDAPEADSWALNGRVGVSHRLARTLSAYAGFNEGVTHYRGAQGRTQGFDAGLNYGDGLTIAIDRRTSLSLSAGASGVYYNGGSHYALTGGAVLTHGMGRTWSSAVGYSRNLGFTSLFDAPVLSDTVYATLGGTLAPRLRWSSGASWSRGTVAFDSSNTVISYTGTSSLQYALSRLIGAYAQYAYYHYDTNAATLFRSSNRFSRQSVAVGLTAYAPLLRRGTGRPRDTR